MDYRLLFHSSLPDLLIPRTLTFSTDSGFTHLYLLHSLQGLKRLTLFIIETYTLFSIPIIFNILHFLDSVDSLLNRYLIHLFQGQKCLTLTIIETYSPWTYTCISICHFR
jgi:hypothetical protein